jgi:hypothetical protein
MIMKALFTLAFITAALVVNAQTDTEILELMLGSKFDDLPNKMKDAGVWMYNHGRATNSAPGTDARERILSVQNGEGHTKVWVIKYNKEGIINEIRINFRHDDRGQVEDCAQMKGYTEFHVGVGSTDAFFKLKK